MNNPTIQEFFWYQGRAIVGFTQSGTTDTNQLFNGYFEQAPGNNGDSIEFIFNLQPGAYQLFFIGFRSTNGGEIDIFVDNVNVGTFNMGNANANNVTQSVGITIVNDETPIRFDVSGTQTGGYAIKMSHIYAKKIGS